MKLNILFVLLFVVSVSLFGQQSKARLNTFKDASDSVFVLPFQSTSDCECFDPASHISTERWNRWRDTLLELSFLCPTPYHTARAIRDFWLWQPAGDTVLTLYFGEGVTVQVYKSERSFPEIAFAEGFQQFQNDTSELMPAFGSETPPDRIVDTNWVMRGISGMANQACFLEGPHWEGLCCVTDTRANWPEGHTTYIAEVLIALLVCRSPSGDNIAFLFREDLDDEEDVPGHEQPERLSMVGFYQLIASVRWLDRR